MQELTVLYEDCHLGKHAEIVNAGPCMLLYAAASSGGNERSAENIGCRCLLDSLESAVMALQRQLLLDPPDLRSDRHLCHQNHAPAFNYDTITSF